MRSTPRTVVAWLAFGLMTLILFQNLRVPKNDRHITFNKFIENVKANQIENVTFKEHGRIEGKFVSKYESGANFETIGETSSEFYLKLLNDHGIVPNYEREEGNSLFIQYLLSWAPLLIILGLMFVFLRQIQASGGKAMAFGRSRAKLLTEGHTKVNFMSILVL